MIRNALQISGVMRAKGFAAAVDLGYDMAKYQLLAKIKEYV